MKKPIYLIGLSIILLACEEDIVNLKGDRLAKIEKHYGQLTELEYFTYNTSGQLIEVFKSIPMEDTDGDQLILFSYKDEKLVSRIFQPVNEQDFYWKDSIVYNTEGLVSDIYHFYIEDNTRTLSFTNRFIYGDNMEVNRFEYIYHNQSADPLLIGKVFWKGGNVSKIEFWKSGFLSHETAYEYDNGINYKKGKPYFLDSYYFDHLSELSENNIVLIRITDHGRLGLVDLFCNPCSYNYTYNDRQMPTAVEMPTGDIFKISYAY